MLFTLALPGHHGGYQGPLPHQPALESPGCPSPVSLAGGPAAASGRVPGYLRWPGASGPSRASLVVGRQVLSVVHVDWDGTTRRPSANGSCNLHNPVRATGGEGVRARRGGQRGFDALPSDDGDWKTARATMGGRRAWGIREGGGGAREARQPACDAQDGRQRPIDPSPPSSSIHTLSPPWLTFHRSAPWKCYWETPRDLTIYGTTTMAEPPGRKRAIRSSWITLNFVSMGVGGYTWMCWHSQACQASVAKLHLFDDRSGAGAFMPAAGCFSQCAARFPTS